MNTHDKIELPTLPEPFTYIYPGKSEGALYHTGHMQDYALAAIEADRQRRGAPVERPDEYVYFSDWYCKDAPDESEVPSIHMARHAWLAGIRFADLFPVADSQPAEPVAYTSAMGEAAQSYYDRFTYAHKLPAQFRWSEVWDSMASAAPQPAEPVKQETMTARELADRVARGEKWKIAEPVSRDVEALVRLLEDGEWAEHVARTPLGQRLEFAITTLVGEASKPHNEPVKVPSDAEIREVFLANGFTIKPGQDDLKEYVYEAARALLAQYGRSAP